MQETVISFPRYAIDLLWSTALSWIQVKISLLLTILLRSMRSAFFFFLWVWVWVWNSQCPFHGKVFSWSKKPFGAKPPSWGSLFCQGRIPLSFFWSRSGTSTSFFWTAEQVVSQLGCPYCAGGLCSHVSLSLLISINPLQQKLFEYLSRLTLFFKVKIILI